MDMPKAIVSLDAASIYSAAPVTISGDTRVVGVSSSSWSSASALSEIAISDFATREELCDMVAKLGEIVYSQEMRIRKLEEIINEQNN